MEKTLNLKTQVSILPVLIGFTIIVVLLWVAYFAFPSFGVLQANRFDCQTHCVLIEGKIGLFWGLLAGMSFPLLFLLTGKRN